MDGDLSATLTLRRGALARVGLERVAMVEAVAELGSITAAAKKLGLSYKAPGMSFRPSTTCSTPR